MRVGDSVKKVAVIILSVAIVVTGLILVTLKINKDDSAIQNTDEQLQVRVIEAITKGRPSLLDNGKPIIEVDSLSHHNSWYIASIKSVNETGDAVPVKVVLIDSNGVMRSILGPETRFTEAEMLKYNIPDSVIQELQKI